MTVYVLGAVFTPNRYDICSPEAKAHAKEHDI